MHALQELSDAAAVLAEGSLVGPLDRQRRLRWAERLQVTQSSLPTQVSTCPLAFQCEAGASYRPRVCSASEQHKALCSLFLPLTSAHCEGAFTSAARRPVDNTVIHAWLCRDTIADCPLFTPPLRALNCTDICLRLH